MLRDSLIYRQSKSDLAGSLDAVVQDANAVSAKTK